MLTFVKRWFATFLALSVLLALGSVERVSAFQTTASYAELDRVEGPFVNLNTPSIRPMVLIGNSLYAVNTHDSTVSMFSGSSSSPAGGPWGVPWGPVSIGKWTPSGQATQLIVVCRGSSCLVRMDQSGNILGLVHLQTNSNLTGGSILDSGGPVGASDLLVHNNTSKAYVSCAWIDAVLEVDLTNDTVSNRWDEAVNSKFRMKSPLFLSFWGSGPAFTVAPLLSGNNTTADGGTPTSQAEEQGPQAASSVLDLGSGSSPFVDQLPDEDLFYIDPTVSPVSSSTAVVPVVRAAGTVLFAHGYNSTTQKYWILNTDAHNADPTKQSEPKVKGVFATNQLTIMNTFSTSALTDTHTSGAATIVSLDSIGSPSFSVGQPYALAFRSNGEAFACGLLTDNVVWLDSSGGLKQQLTLPDGAIPRGLLINGSGNFLMVYCWGTNQIRAYSIPGSGSISNTPTYTYELGNDPTPSGIKNGRKLFYDASFSANGNVSCATCHVEGHTDMLAWNLSNLPLDDKGPMVTQTLAGIERMAPFHWRGERALADFHPAFQALLGSASLPTSGDLGDFDKFITSLANPANPYEHADGIVTSSIYPTVPGSYTPNAVDGQTLYRNTETFEEDPPNTFNLRCNDCHAAPTGTVNDIHPDFRGGGNPRRTDFKPAPFLEMWAKSQSRVELRTTTSSGSPSVIRGYLGAAVSHAGLIPDVFSFIGHIPVRNQNRADLTGFIFQWDQGLAPAAHAAVLLNSTTSSTAQSYIDNYLKAQALPSSAGLRNCDIVVFGKSTVGGSLIYTRWYLDRYDTTPSFLNENGTTRRSFTDFYTAASTESNVFLGLPVGMGRRFGIDYDEDGIANGADSTDYTVDVVTDGVAPIFKRGPEVLWFSSRAARIRWDTDEPATGELQYMELPSGSWQSITTRNLGTTQSLVINNLRPSTTTAATGYSAGSVQYDFRVRVADAGNTVSGWQYASSYISTKDFIEHRHLSSVTAGVQKLILGQHVARSTVLTRPDPTNAPNHFRAEVSVDFKRGTAVSPRPASSRSVVGRVFVKSSTGTEFTPPTAGETLSASTGSLSVSAVQVHGSTTSTVTSLNVGSGPFLVSTSLTDATNGKVTMEFDLTGWSSGEEVLFNVESILEFFGTSTQYASTITSAQSSGTFYMETDIERTSGSSTSPVAAFAEWDFPTTKEAGSKSSVVMP